MFDGLFHTDTICDKNRRVRLHLIRCCDFLRFRISEKMGEYLASIKRSNAKNCFSFRGLRPSDPPTDVLKNVLK